MVIDANIGFCLFSSLVTQAYLRIAEILMQYVLINLPREYILSSGQFIQLLKPLYALSENVNDWSRKLRAHLEMELGMKSCVSDIALSFNCTGDHIERTWATYVNGTIHEVSD